MNVKLKLLIVSNSIFVFAGSLFVPLYAFFILQLKGGAELAGALIAVQFFISFLTGLFVVRLKDGRDLDGLLLKTNYTIRFFGWLTLAFFPTLPVLFFVQVLNGIAEAIGSPAFNTLISDNLDNNSHIKDWGIWELIKNPVISLASLIGGFVVTLFGFNILFGIMATFALISLITYQLHEKQGVSQS